MTFWFRWKSADGDEGPAIGPFAHRREAEAALLVQVVADADVIAQWLARERARLAPDTA